MLPIFYVCSTCGQWISPLDGDPDRCPRENGSGSHCLSREIDPAPLHFPELGPKHPFLRYRELLTMYHRARHEGVTDRAYVEAVLAGENEPPEEAPRHWRSLNAQTGLSAEAGVFLLPSGKSGDEDRRLRFAKSLQVPWNPSAPLDSVEAPTETAIRESLRLRAYQLVSWTLQHGAPFNRIFLSGGDRRFAAAFGEGLRDAVRLGALPVVPRIHLVVPEEDVAVTQYEKAIDAVLQAMNAGRGRQSILDAARRDPQLRRQVGDSVRAGLRRDGEGNPVRSAAEDALGEAAALDLLDPTSFLVLRSFIESGGFPVTVYDQTLQAAGRVVGEAEPILASQDAASAGELVAGLLLLRAHGDIDAKERICLVVP